MAISGPTLDPSPPFPLGRSKYRGCVSGLFALAERPFRRFAVSQLDSGGGTSGPFSSPSLLCGGAGGGVESYHSADTLPGVAYA